MAMYDRQWFLDVRAVLDTANSLKQTPPQNEVEPKPEPEAPAYSYSSGDLSDQPDYGMYAGFVEPAVPNRTPYCRTPLGDEPCKADPSQMVHFWGADRYVTRVSIESNDPGYEAYEALSFEGRLPKIMLDGEDCLTATTADSAEGYIVRLAKHQPMSSAEWKYEVVYGDVKIVIPPKASR